MEEGFGKESASWALLKEWRFGQELERKQGERVCAERWVRCALSL